MFQVYVPPDNNMRSNNQLSYDGSYPLSPVRNQATTVQYVTAPQPPTPPPPTRQVIIQQPSYQPPPPPPPPPQTVQIIATPIRNYTTSANNYTTSVNTIPINQQQLPSPQTQYSTQYIQPAPITQQQPPQPDPRTDRLEQELWRLQNLIKNLENKSQPRGDVTQDIQNELKRIMAQLEIKDKIIKQLSEGQTSDEASSHKPDDYDRRRKSPYDDNRADNLDRRKRFPYNQSGPLQQDDYDMDRSNKRSPYDDLKRQPIDDGKKPSYDEANDLALLRQQLLRLQQENQQLKDQPSTIDDQENELARLRKQLADKNRQLADLQDQLDNANLQKGKDKNQLENKLRALQDQADQVDNLEGKLGKQKQELRDKDDEIDQLKSMLSKLQGELKGARGDNENLQKQIQTINAEKDGLQQQLGGIKQIFGFTDFKLLLSHLQDMIDQEAKYEKTIHDLEELIKSLRFQNQQMKEQIDFYEHEHQYLENYKMKYAQLYKVGEEKVQLLMLLTFAFAEIDALRSRPELQRPTQRPLQAIPEVQIARPTRSPSRRGLAILQSLTPQVQVYDADQLSQPSLVRGQPGGEATGYPQQIYVDPRQIQSPNSQPLAYDMRQQPQQDNRQLQYDARQSFDPRAQQLVMSQPQQRVRDYSYPDKQNSSNDDDY